MPSRPHRLSAALLLAVVSVLAAAVGLHAALADHVRGRGTDDSSRVSPELLALFVRPDAVAPTSGSTSLENDIGSFGVSLSEPGPGETALISQADAARAIEESGVLADRTGTTAPKFRLATMTRPRPLDRADPAERLVWQVIFRGTAPDVHGPSDMPSSVRAAYERSYCVSQALVDARSGVVVQGMQQRRTAQSQNPPQQPARWPQTIIIQAGVWLKHDIERGVPRWGLDSGPWASSSLSSSRG